MIADPERKNRYNSGLVNQNRELTAQKSSLLAVFWPPFEGDWPMENRLSLQQSHNKLFVFNEIMVRAPHIFNLKILHT